MRLKNGDQIIVRAGKDKGRKGRIEKVFPRKGLVLVPGINVYKRHLKPQGEKKPGGIVDLALPLPVSRVSLLCPKCNQATRVGWLITKDKKERICKKCQALI